MITTLPYTRRRSNSAGEKGSGSGSRPAANLADLADAALRLYIIGEKGLMKVVPGFEYHEYEDAVARAKALVARAEEIARRAALESGERTRSNAIEELRQSCPGFSDEVYRETFSFGQFLSTP